MVQATTRGGDTVDFLVLSSAFGRDGPGILSESGDAARYAWTTPAGREAVAQGEPGSLDADLSGAPSGRAERLELAVSAGATLTLEADRPWIRLGLLAGEAPPGGALDPILRGEDRLTATGAGRARLFGDGLMAEDRDRGRADLFDLSGEGWRQAAGDFWLVPSTIFQVKMGDDDMRIDSRGRIEVWGDAVLATDKVGHDGALLRGGDDRLDAREALAGARDPDAPVMIGDVGMVGAGWLFRGGDDLLIAPRDAGAAMTGDVLSGDADAHLYCGDDVLRGGGGDDVLFGDAQDLLEPYVSFRPGKDVLRGGGGDDHLYGDLRSADALTFDLGRNPGADRLFGGAGRDRAEGGWGADRIFGGAGRDRLRGDAGGDRIEGEGGVDRLWGGGGEDRLAGGGAGDRLFGNGGGDRLFGGGGDDRLSGGGGGDRLSGAAGDDRLRGDLGRDRLLGGEGRDKLHGAAGRDRLEGGAGRDRLDGGGADDTLHGGGGGDVIKGRHDDDAACGGAGRDRLLGGAGDDRLFGGAGGDRLFGGEGEDRLEGGAGRDRLYGEAGADVFRLARGGGRDVAEDFDPDADWLSIERGLGEIAVHDTTRGVLVSARGASMLLLGVELETLDPLIHDWLG